MLTSLQVRSMPTYVLVICLCRPAYSSTTSLLLSGP
ncbi:hypothetical protein PVAP13_5KG340235 [Panicum virgatum]|uniref:Uncharacterized protein n=1 Tax=Panicum virgatum TaxID=38727 RepID=A0A8T0SQI5_PANVG|nr:hypothetical protein PVAP13_5KG340235 [Panicum virgatum]